MRGSESVSVQPRDETPRALPPGRGYPAAMVSIAVVFSAGGAKGDPWHSGVVGALAEHTSWDSGDAELLVGTSAGAFTATALRAGLRAADLEARHVGDPISDEGQAIIDRIVTPYDEPEVDRNWSPSSPKMTLQAMWPPWKADPVESLGIFRGGHDPARRSPNASTNSCRAGFDRPTWVARSAPPTANARLRT